MRRAIAVAIMAGGTACSAPASTQIASVVVHPLPPAPPVVVAPPEVAPPLSPIPIDERDMAWGRDDAPVAVVVFADIVSPYMARAWSTLIALRAAYPPEQLRIVLKHLPLPEIHPTSALAAEATQGVYVVAGPDVAWKFLGLAFASREFRDHIARAELVGWARTAGVSDLTAFERGLDAHQWASKPELDVKTARRLSVDGSPQSFVNGVRLVGAQSIDAFTKIVDSELAAAQQLRDAGTPAREISASRTLQAFRSGTTDALRFDRAAMASEEATTLAVPTYAMPIDGALVLGPATALVTVVAFGDPEGRSCSALRDRLDRLRQDLGDDVRVVWRSMTSRYPLRRTDANANFIAEVRAQKGDAAGWLALERFCGDEPVADAPYDGLAAELGVDAAKARRAVTARTHQAEIERATNLAEDFARDGFGADDELFIDGHFFARRIPVDLDGDGVPSFTYDEDALARALEQELNRSRAMVRAGVARDRVYATKQATALAPPVPTIAVDAPAPTAMPSSGPIAAKVVVQELVSLPCNEDCVGERAAFRAAIAGELGRVRIITRVLANDGPAAEAALEVFAQRGASGFTRFLARLAAKPAWGRAELDAVARSLGLDMKRYTSALDRHAHAAEAKANRELASSAHFASTGFIIGDLPVAANQRAERYRTLIGRALTAAR